MPHLMLLEAVEAEAGAGFRARLVGAEHQQVAARMHAGDLLDEIDADHAERVRRAVATGKPVYWRGEGETPVAMGDFPFASDGRHVDRVVSVVVGCGKRRFYFG